MADGVQITAGSGTTILTDDTGASGHAQVVKLAISTDGSGTLVPADSSNGIDVDVTRVSGSVTVVGDVANDSADSGNPVKIGGFAEVALSTATMVADGDRVNFVGDIDGAQMVKPYAPYGDILVERLSNTDGASTASTVFGATAGARNMITTISVYNASTTNAYVDIRDGTAGTILFTIPCPANGGAITNFPVPLRQTTANTALAFDASAALTTLYISFIGFKSKV